MTPGQVIADDAIELYTNQEIIDLAARIDAAILIERENCARIADNPYSDQVKADGSDEPSEVGKKIATAIRARITDTRPH